ncbi:MAG: HD domain-containing protein [Solirubrobacteraceae bacterium]|nr:HD domain-containing protein [Solirubrobacteraceae bacterium]
MALVALPGWLAVAVVSGPDPISNATHAVVTALMAVVLAVLGAVIARTAWRRNDARTMLGAFCMGMSTILLLTESIALAGDLPPDAGVLRLSGLLVIPLGSAILMAARIRGVVRPGRELVVLRTGVITLTVTALICASWLANPSALSLTIGAGSLSAMILFATAAPLLAATAWSACRTAMLTRRPLDSVLCVGLLWLVPAHLALATSLPGDARWAAGHALQFAGFSLMAIQTAVDLSRHVASGSLTGGLRSTALVERSAEFLGARVSALVDRMVEKDPSTAGHVERVAVLAVQMGEHLHLPTGRLRLLAAGGLLHDIGKLSVPTEILQKPGRLTDDEFEVVQKHPADGRALLTELGGFHALVLDLVEHHHERVDGTGYPHGRQGDQLPLEVRILAVADVFDALTTDRPYRRACTAADALAELDQQAGTGLDSRCVAALRDVIGQAQLVEIGQRARRPRPILAADMRRSA